MLDGSSITFSRNGDGSFTPEPGKKALTLTLTKINDNTYRLVEADDQTAEFTRQGGTTDGVLTVTTSFTADDDSELCCCSRWVG